MPTYTYNVASCSPKKLSKAVETALPAEAFKLRTAPGSPSGVDVTFVFDSTVSDEPTLTSTVTAHVPDAAGDDPHYGRVVYSASGVMESRTLYSDAARTIKAAETLYTYDGKYLVTETVTEFDVYGNQKSQIVYEYTTSKSGGSTTIDKTRTA